MSQQRLAIVGGHAIVPTNLGNDGARARASVCARWATTVAIAVSILGVARPAPAQVPVEALVSVGSPETSFPRNRQFEVSLALNPMEPSMLAAGAIDSVDHPPCRGSVCSGVWGVGLSGVYLSFDGGASWTQPTYTGLTARTGTLQQGPIGTLPHFDEVDLVSDGDPALAFGPRPGPDGTFDWANGPRLYYATLAASIARIVGADRDEVGTPGLIAVAVSRTDDPRGAAAGNAGAWMRPVIASTRQSEATFADKDHLWVDNASSSPHFGTVYVCWTQFQTAQGLGSSQILLSRSLDGGETWSAPRPLSEAALTIVPMLVGARGEQHFRQSCTMRTDSRGTLYVFYYGGGSLVDIEQRMVRSFDGGFSFERPRVVARATLVVPFDGVQGVVANVFPSVAIANGAPSGVGASDRIVLAWGDGRGGQNSEQALVQTSSDGGETWSVPVNAAAPGDRPRHPAVAISPDGDDVYVVYEGFLDPFRATTAETRRVQGVVRHADGQLTGWGTLHRGTMGDARGTSFVSLEFERLGEYSSVAATGDGAVAVWTDTRNAADCQAVDTFRQRIVDGVAPNPRPAPATDCPATFGNSDIFSVAVPKP